jgi:RND family efflux transporter MFP subunit
MHDRAALLDQLRIDRGRKPRRRFGGAAAVALIAAAAGMIAWRRVEPFRPQVIVAWPHVMTFGGGGRVDAIGYVVARRSATVSAKTTGRVAAFPVEEGQWVNRGQVLATLDDSNIAAARALAVASLAQAEKSMRAARTAMLDAAPAYRRQAVLLGMGVSSHASYDTQKAAYDAAAAAYEVQQQQVAVARAALAEADRSLDDMLIRAPFDGVFTVKAAQIGEIVSPISAGGGFTRTGLGTIVDMASREVETDVSESFIHDIAPGEPAEIRLNAYPDRVLPGQVTLIIPMADRAKATVRVRVGLIAKPDWVFPEMAVRVSFLPHATDAPRQMLVLPATCLRNMTGASEANILVVRDGMVRLQTVRLGERIGDAVQILSGATAADAVIIGATDAKIGDAVVPAGAPG